MSLREEMLSIKEITRSESASWKLLMLTHGLDVDHMGLYTNIDSYPQDYRTKRSAKKIAIREGALIDTETRDVPCIPSEVFVHFPGGRSIVKVNYRPASPFLLLYSQSGLKIVDKNLQYPIFSAELTPLGNLNGKILRDGVKAWKIIECLGADRLSALGFESCEAWLSGKPCKFCDSCAPRPTEQSLKPTINDLRGKYGGNLSAWLQDAKSAYPARLAEAFSLAMKCPPRPHTHFTLLAGNLPDMEVLWRYMVDICATIGLRDYPQVDSYLNVMPPMDSDWLQSAKEAGIKSVCFHLEVFGAENYDFVCPHKSFLMDYDIFLEKLKDAVEVFGANHSRCGIVLGAQDMRDAANGAKKLASMGIAVDYSVFSPKPGTPWWNRPVPSPLEVASFGAELSDIYIANGLSPIYCRLSSRSSIMNEIYDDRR